MQPPPPTTPEDTDPASWGWATWIFLHPNGLISRNHHCARPGLWWLECPILSGGLFASRDAFLLPKSISVTQNTFEPGSYKAFGSRRRYDGCKSSFISRQSGLPHPLAPVTLLCGPIHPPISEHFGGAQGEFILVLWNWELVGVVGILNWQKCSPFPPLTSSALTVMFSNSYSLRRACVCMQGWGFFGGCVEFYM